ncbi:hypothetical protein AMTR_s00010p00117850 [Amborella trichopoda]|uniref:Uncharacterized protein n=1 Tax=Amborella trichopoda TaxID=13333 RepID=W1NFZ2_AMBTC|nr:hypothetical protein AMTR_s00010p00117850 [Amborella trichopoda]
MVGFAEMTAPRSNLERPKSSNNLNLGASWEDAAMAPCFENPKESTNRLTMKEEVEEGKAVPSLMREEGEVRGEGFVENC